MKIALCISGQMRNFENNKDLLKLINEMKCDIFIATWEERGSTTAYDRYMPSKNLAKLLFNNNNGKFLYNDNLKEKYFHIYKLFYKNHSIELSYIEAFLAPFLKKVHIEKFPSDFDEKRSLHGITFPNELFNHMPVRYMYSLPMYYMIYQSDKLRQEYENENKFKYDWVIRVRADIAFNDLKEIVQILKKPPVDNNTIIVPNSIDKRIFVNDMFAIASSDAMKKYSNIFLYLKEYWNLKKHKELSLSNRSAGFLLKYHLDLQKVKIKYLKQTVFINDNIYRVPIDEIYIAFVNDIKHKKILSIKEKLFYGLSHYLNLLNSWDNIKNDEIDHLIKECNFLNHKLNLDVFELSKSKLLKSINSTSLKISLIKAYVLYSEIIPDISIQYALYIFNIENDFIKSINILHKAQATFPKDYFILRELGRIYFENFKKTKIDLYLNLACIFLEESALLSSFKNKITLELLLKIYKSQSRIERYNDIFRNVK